MESLAKYRGDVDVIPFVGIHAGSREAIPEHVKRPVEVAPDIWIGPLGDLKKDVIEASTYPGKNWPIHRIYRCPYALWRINAPKSPVDGVVWDSDHKLTRVMQLLRLVKPSTWGYRYACRLHLAEEPYSIESAEVVGQGALAYLTPGRVDGIGAADVSTLAGLVIAFDPATLPNRVRNAIWMHEHLAWTRLMNIRWPLVVTALEALVHTGDRGRPGGAIMRTTEQFVRRLDKLQSLIGAHLWSQGDLEAIYDHRSSFTHGRGGLIKALEGEALRLYDVAENGLRSTIRAAIMSTAAADVVRSDESIRTALGF